uniref:GK20310 n=1 Tax=Drosophila willistoni TaxID=7260 RepID=B4N5J4_DROWI
MLEPPSSSCPSSSSSSSTTCSSARTCLKGCLDVKPSDLRRFPVHDPNRCKHWLRYFRISDQLLTKLGGLKKLRICHRHFHNPQVMARTRIKMTPLRKTKQQCNSNNGNGTATNTTTTTTTPTTTTTTTIINGTGTGKPLLDDATTIELVETPIEVVAQQKHHHHQMLKKNSVTTTITLPTMVSVPPPPPPLLLPPQRSHSICSSASSDVQSINSDCEATSLENLENGRKRKLYVITEKYDETTPTNKNAADLTNGNGLITKKRKMFVVVEQEKDGQSKKLMIMTDKQQNGVGGGPTKNLSEKLEKLLPELLNCIQTKELQQQQRKELSSSPPPPPPASSAQASSKSSSIIANKSPITLPPKKNPTNFMKVDKSLSSSSSNQTEITAPSPHSVTILPSRKDDQVMASNDLETNINLSPDFRFLMKILPKLEQLPEPHKQDVKRSIQIFVEKSYSIYGKKD